MAAWFSPPSIVHTRASTTCTMEIFVFRSDPPPKASVRPRMEVRGERSEAANGLRTSLTSSFELATMGGGGWCGTRGGESILYSKYDLIDGAAESVESCKAGGYNGRRRHQ
jgi:hypothetical protein